MAGRALARSFGRAALDYERGRPEWSDEPLELLPLGVGAEVLDLGAGTGKLTRLLARRYSRVIAVEPDADMRALIEGGEPLPGSAEAIPLPDASVDAVFVADAFHWFETVRALDEIARVLRPGGVLALLWKWWDESDPPLPPAARARLKATFDRAWPDGSPPMKEHWRAAFPDPRFAVLREQTFERELVVDAAGLAALWLSVSSVMALPRHERAGLAAELSGLLSGSYRLPVTTQLCWTRLEPERAGFR